MFAKRDVDTFTVPIILTFLLLFLFVLVGCGGSTSDEGEPVAAARAEIESTSTATSIPTDTPMPTDTPTATATPTETPTATPEPTDTLEPTNTATPTRKATLTPPPMPTPNFEERPLASLLPENRNSYFSEPPPLVIDKSKVHYAVITTTDGEMRFRLFNDKAPIAVNNFAFLANQGYYDNTTFHRVLEDFMAQGGDPLGRGFGGPGYQFRDEVDPELLFNRRGVLAMANAGPNSNGSQFFITFVPAPWLDGTHTIFGQLIEGDEVLSAIMLRDPSDVDAPAEMILRIDVFEADAEG